MDTKVLHHLTYGLYVLSVKAPEGDNACIINTAVQVATNPARISISVVRDSYTCALLQKTGAFNLSALSADAEFSVFSRFGMQSGRETDKFSGFDATKRSANGLLYITKWTNAYLSVRVDATHDLGSHILFIGTVTDGEVLSDMPACTYAQYHKEIKPQPKTAGWRCRVCGYVYAGETLPEGFICPICKHGTEDFEKEEEKPKETEYVCTVCGYVHAGSTPPDACPICGVGSDKFSKK